MYSFLDHNISYSSIKFCSSGTSKSILILEEEQRLGVVDLLEISLLYSVHLTQVVGEVVTCNRNLC